MQRYIKDMQSLQVGINVLFLLLISTFCFLVQCNILSLEQRVASYEKGAGVCEADDTEQHHWSANLLAVPKQTTTLKICVDCGAVHYSFDFPIKDSGNKEKDDETMETGPDNSSS